MSESLMWAFLHVYHSDKANACMHCAPVRFSPLTFRLAREIDEALLGTGEETTFEVNEVLSHVGMYAEDPGR